MKIVSTAPTEAQLRYWGSLKGKPTWNTGLKGVMKPNTGSFKKGSHVSPTTEIKKGQRLSPATEFKKGQAPFHKGKKMLQWSGENHWNWRGGKPKCKVCDKDLGGYSSTYCNSCATKIFRSGENCNTWKGGITPLRKLIRELPEYKKWRIAVFKRDGYKCLFCGCNKSGNLNADHYPRYFATILEKNHIKTTEDARHCEELWKIDNGRTLCIECHRQTPNYFRRTSEDLRTISL